MSGQKDVFNITIRTSTESQMIDICNYICRNFTDYSHIIIKQNGNDVMVTMFENGNRPSLDFTI